MREFTDPPGAPRAGLLAMTLHEGQHAAWIAAVGDPALRVQQEMLTLFAVTLRVNQVAYPEGESGLPVITVEVSEP